MKYVKTFENFEYNNEVINEEFIGKLKEWWKGKKEKAQQKLLELIKKSPEAQKKLEEAKKEIEALKTKSPEDYKKMQQIAAGEAVIDPDKDPVKDEKVTESLLLLEGAAKDIAIKILKWLGFTVAALAAVAALVAVITIAVKGSAFMLVFGVSLGNITAMAFGIGLGSSVVGAIASGVESDTKTPTKAPVKK